jgi:glycosyltransferase involved in cell wall biosynthesis
MYNVSVVIPTYNRSKLLLEALDSVFQQTFKDYEVIIIDDGSTDETRSLLEQHALTRKFKYIYQENSGSSAARNNGVRHARHGLIAFLDSDDIWHPQKLEKQIKFLKDHPEADLVFSNADVVNEHGDFLWSYITPRERKIRPQAMFDELLVRNFIPLDSFLVKKECLENIGLFDESMQDCEDYDLLLKIARSFSMFCLDESLTKVRNTTGNKSSNSVSRYQNTIIIISKYLPSEEPHHWSFRFRKKFARNYFELGNALFAQDRMPEAKNALIKAISIWPFLNLKQYLLVLVLMLPKKYVHQLKALKKTL